jgi:hypothetical protein
MEQGESYFTMGDVGNDILSCSREDIGRECHLYPTAKFGLTVFAQERNGSHVVRLEIQLKDQTDDVKLAQLTPEGRSNIYCASP